MRSILKKEDKTGIVVNKQTGKEIDICGGDSVVAAIKAISAYGLITFSRTQNFKGTNYNIYFFKPVQGLRSLYNLGNEMLILGCSDSMRDFKSRTKDFIDYILTTKEEFKNRLDRITCIILDENKNIVKTVKDDRTENPDARLIVPFHIEELQNGISEENFQTRMREFLYARDLFGMSSPLNDDAYFFGEERHDVISELYGKYKHGEHGGLFGLRRIGKTSVLNLLKNRIGREGGIAVYFDCQKYHHSRWNIFLKQIIERVVRECEESDVLKSHNRVTVSTDAKRYSEDSASLSFEEDIKSIYNNIGKTRILLIFDEIESIGYKTSPSEQWGKGLDALYFWEVLRATSQTNNHYFCYLVAGVNPICMEMANIQDKPNPIFANFSPIYMSLFDYNDIKIMLSSIGGHMGLEFEESIYAKLLEDYGGHPFLIRQVCSRINNDLLREKVVRPYIVSKHYYDLHSSGYISDLSNVLEQILDVLIKNFYKEYTLLKNLSINGRDSFKKELLDEDRSIQHLLGYNLIEKDRGEYFVRIKSVESYMQNKYLNDKELNEQHEKRARINLRRDLIETKLRSLIWTSVKLRYGKKSRDRIIEMSNSEDPKQKEKMMRQDGQNAMQELYFNQCQTLIDKEWKHYEQIFNDKAKFDNFYEIMNRSRTLAAHTKPISEEDEALFNIAFTFFEEKLIDL